MLCMFRVYGQESCQLCTFSCLQRQEWSNIRLPCNSGTCAIDGNNVQHSVSAVLIHRSYNARFEFQ